MLFTLSNLNLNLALTLGYFNTALNNSAQTTNPSHPQQPLHPSTNFLNVQKIYLLILFRFSLDMLLQLHHHIQESISSKIELSPQDLSQYINISAAFRQGVLR